MKKYITTTCTKIALMAFMLFSTLINAQTDLPDAPDDGAAAPVPINDYVWLWLIVAISFAILKFRAIYKKGLQIED